MEHSPRRNALLQTPKSRLSWIIGGCAGCGCLAVVLAVVLSVIGSQSGKPMPSQNKATSVENVSGRGADDSQPTNLYLNEPELVPMSLKGDFVPFSFHYPPKFEMVPDESNFVKVEERKLVKGEEFTLENFAVGSLTIPPSADDNTTYKSLLDQVAKLYEKTFPNFDWLAQSPQDVGGYRGRALTWIAERKNTTQGDIKIYGRTLVVHEPGQPQGVSITMIATSLDGAVSHPQEVGVKGDLAVILNSFKLLPAEAETSNEMGAAGGE